MPLALWEQCRGKRKEMQPYRTKNNDNLLSERLKKKTNGFRNWQIKPSAFDTSNLRGCAPQKRHSNQTAFVPKAFVTSPVDKFRLQLLAVHIFVINRKKYVPYMRINPGINTIIPAKILPSTERCFPLLHKWADVTCNRQMSRRVSRSAVRSDVGVDVGSGRERLAKVGQGFLAL